MIIPVKSGQDEYNIVLQAGGLENAGKIFNLKRKVLIVSDSGIPEKYTEKAALLCQKAYKYIFPQGEASKNMENYQKILASLVENSFSRTDCVLAIGGGVTGDMAGFAAATYMRGIDFYNIPTSLLAQVDSSVGGKVAIDFMNYKNIVGAFYQPKGVLIDVNLLQTLAPRHVSNGMAEVIKMAACCDAELFRFLENEPRQDNMEIIIEKALKIKKSVVESDAAEKGLRRVLNFGHTVGHAIESAGNFSELLHGECVGLGMLLMSEGEAKARIKALLEKAGLPVQYNYDKEKVLSSLAMDKKADGDSITIVKVKEIGSFEFEKLQTRELKKRLTEVM